MAYAAKYRCKGIYGNLKRGIGEIRRKFFKQKGIENMETEACSDPIHILVRNLPYISINCFMEFMKEGIR